VIAVSRNARRQLASRLRALRETGFDVKLTQDQLAAALGEGKPLSSAAISNWENGEIGKLPTESRLMQYALIFCTPRSLEPEPHIPPESTLDRAARTRFNELRAELLKLRAEADAEARRERTDRFDAITSEANELWHHDRMEKMFVVSSELPAADRAWYADPDSPNYVRLARYGDLDAFFEMYVALTRMGYRNLSHRSARELGIGTARNLVLIGGPVLNSLTRTFLHLLNSPITQLMTPDGEPDIFTMADGSKVYPTVIPLGGGRSQVMEDVGLFVRAPNPTNPVADVTICSGIYTYGVLGAVHAFTYPPVARENVEVIRDRLGQTSSFAALFSVKAVDHRVPTPRLASALIDCAAIE
jgi:transcriptional regulator with XRE-family HTH domain